VSHLFVLNKYGTSMYPSDETCIRYREPTTVTCFGF